MGVVEGPEDGVFEDRGAVYDPGFIEQLSGLANSSVVVWKVSSYCVLERRGGHWLAVVYCRPYGLMDFTLGWYLSIRL